MAAGLAITTSPTRKPANAGADKPKGPVEMGVDCFKTDFGVFPRTACFVQEPQKMHNHYAYIYNELV